MKVEQQSSPASIWRLLRKVHHDEQGAVSIETVLIIAAIALPILIFVIKYGWPRIKLWFNTQMNELEAGGDAAAGRT